MGLIVNLLVCIGAVVFMAFLFIPKLMQKPLEWPDLAEYGEPTEMWVKGMDDMDVFPQYGYYRYRGVYMNMRRVPIVVLEPYLVDDEFIAYNFVQVTDGEHCADLADAVMLLGTEKPVEIVNI